MMADVLILSVEAQKNVLHSDKTDVDVWINVC